MEIRTTNTKINWFFLVFVNKKESGDNMLCYSCKKAVNENVTALFKECTFCKNLFIGSGDQSICNICSEKEHRCEICGKKISSINKKYAYKSERKLTNALF